MQTENTEKATAVLGHFAVGAVVTFVAVTLIAPSLHLDTDAAFPGVMVTLCLLGGWIAANCWPGGRARSATYLAPAPAKPLATYPARSRTHRIINMIVVVAVFVGVPLLFVWAISH